MIKKNENCLYCGEKMDSKTAKKKFCSPKCRIYYSREKERGTLGLDIKIKDGEAVLVKYERESVLPTTIDNSAQIADLEEKRKNLPPGQYFNKMHKLYTDQINKLKSNGK